jgi:2-iminobutanoate/2-iminopropanoate deaminase
MANKIGNPTTVAGPFGAYSQYCELEIGARFVQTAGQVGVKTDGAISDDIEDQCHWALLNLLAVLADVDMGAADITKLTVLLLDQAHVKAYRSARDGLLGAFRPPTTLMIVKGLANPSWKVEIEACAAKAR